MIYVMLELSPTSKIVANSLIAITSLLTKFILKLQKLSTTIFWLHSCFIRLYLILSTSRTFSTIRMELPYRNTIRHDPTQIW